MTRRVRISDFALGALIAVAPGAIQTAFDWAEDSTRQWPSVGHIVEIVFAIMAFTAVLKSLCDFSKPTSRDELEQIFPGLGRETTAAWRLGKLWRRFKGNFNNT